MKLSELLEVWRVTHTHSTHAHARTRTHYRKLCRYSFAPTRKNKWPPHSTRQRQHRDSTCKGVLHVCRAGRGQEETLFPCQGSWQTARLPATFYCPLQSVCSQRRRPGLHPWVGKMPWRRKWQPTPVLLPRKFHRWRSLVGYRPWGRKEPDTTDRLHSLHPL